MRKGRPKPKSTGNGSQQRTQEKTSSSHSRKASSTKSSTKATKLKQTSSARSKTATHSATHHSAAHRSAASAARHKRNRATPTPTPSSFTSFETKTSSFPTLQEAYPEVYDRDDIKDLQLDAAAIDAKVQCPISLEYFRDPVLAMDGNHYEAEIIKMWMVVSLSQGTKLLSPLTNAPMGTKLVRDPEKRLQTLRFVEKHGMQLGPLPASQQLPEAYQKKAALIGSRNAIRIRLSEMQKGKGTSQDKTQDDVEDAPPSQEMSDSLVAMRLEKKMKDRNQVLDASFKLEKLLYAAEAEGLWNKKEMSRESSMSSSRNNNSKNNTTTDRQGVGGMFSALMYQATLTLHANRVQDVWYCIRWRNKLVHYDPNYPDRESFDSEGMYSSVVVAVCFLTTITTISAAQQLFPLPSAKK